MVNHGRRIFTIILILALVIGLVLGGYLIYRLLSDKAIRDEAAQAVDEFEDIIKVVLEDEPNNTVTENESEEGQTTRRAVSGIRYKTFPVVGTIYIPKTGAKYPIVYDYSPAAMDSAIVMLYGPGLNEVGNTVIVGHNYRNGNFFGSNKRLQEGDLIYITDLMGRQIEYTIYNKYETSDVDFAYATRETNGAREISLSTCTSNAAVRLIIWAKES